MVDKNRRIPVGELSAYERWELPNIGSTDELASKAQSKKTEKIKPPTAEQIEAITKQAYESGFEEGHKDGFPKGAEAGRTAGHAEGLESGKSEGYAQGLAQAQNEVNEKLAGLESLVSQIVSPIEQQQKVVEEALLNVAVALSRAVIHRELTIDSSILSLTVSRILEDLPALDSGVVLKVNERDLEQVGQILKGLAANVDLVSEPSVLAGGFLIKTSAQVIDYTVEKRFQKAVQGMLDSAVNKRPSGMQEVPATISTLSDYSSDTLNQVDSATEIEPSSLSDSSTGSQQSQHAIDPEKMTAQNTSLEPETTNDQEGRDRPEPSDE